MNPQEYAEAFRRLRDMESPAARFARIEREREEREYQDAIRDAQKAREAR